MLGNELDTNSAKGTIIFTNASAALKGFPSSGAFAMACRAKSGLAQSMAREMMPKGIHIANVPIDAAIGWTQDDGTRAPRRTYLQLHWPASVDLGVRSRTAAMDREVATGRAVAAE